MLLNVGEWYATESRLKKTGWVLKIEIHRRRFLSIIRYYRENVKVVQEICSNWFR